jgi:phosphoribosylanthranilate isomerase
VCGITRREDLQAMNRFATPVDFVGFVLYPQSKRYAGNALKELADTTICANTARVGVFVNEKPERVLKVSNEHQLDYVQLHGSEPPDYCKTVQQSVKVIKAFNVDETFDFKQLNAYKSCCDYFLFDAKGKLPGGNSISYDWSILHRYEMDKPVFLSGGINPNHAEQLSSFRHPAFYAIDINSGFEISPGVKDTSRIESFLKTFKIPTGS